MDYLKRATEVDLAAFDQACGVGVVVSPAQIREVTARAIEKRKAELLAERYSGPLPAVLQELRDTLKWGDGKIMKEEFDAQILALLGPKTDEDNKPKVAPPPSNHPFQLRFQSHILFEFVWKGQGEEEGEGEGEAQGGRTDC